MTENGSVRRCRECGLELPSRAANGACPNCLLSLALTPSPGGESDEGFEVFDGVGSSPSGGGGPVRAKRILGGFELLEEIATGGMGVVWKARQFGLNRVVALKTLHAGSLASASARLRFRMEVEAVARLNHPNIVSLFETGDAEGVHFYTMTLVEGGDLARCLSDGTRRPGLRGLVELLVKVVRAVDYAHRRGILHRDLKPSNVLLDAQGEPLIADFGLARPLMLEGDLTQSGTILGSPHYMAPEQARGEGGEPSVATDVYSLGAILYEMVAGHPPFEAPTMLQVLDLVRTAEPEAPSRRSDRLEGVSRAAVRDLDTIALKCLSKSPAARYATARELAEELDRWLSGEPILARPVGVTERLWRWSRREPALAVSALATVVLLVAGAAGAMIHGWRMERANRLIAGQAAQLRSQNTALRLREAEALFEQDEASKAVATLAGLVRGDPNHAVASARLESALRLRRFARPAGYPLAHSRSVAGVAWGAEEGTLLTVTEDAGVRTWSTTNALALGDSKPLLAGATWAVVAEAGGMVGTGRDRRVEWWQLPERRLRSAVELPAATKVVRFSTDARLGVTADVEGRVRCWWVADGSPASDEMRVEGGVAELIPVGTDADRVVTVSETGVVQVWDREAGRELWRIATADREVPRVAVDAEGRRWMWAFGDRLEELDGTTGVVRGSRRWGADRVGRMTFSPDGGRLALVLGGAGGHRVELVPSEAWTTEGQILRHRQEIRSVVFSRNGRRLLTASSDNTARVWEVSTGHPEGEPLRHSIGVYLARFSPDETRVVTACFGGWVWIWSLPEPVRVPELELGQAVTALVLSKDGERVAAGGLGGRVAWWRSSDPSGPRSGSAHVGRVWHVEFSPDERWLASAGSDGMARVTALESGEERRFPHTQWTWVMTAHFDATGTRLVTAGHDRHVIIWDLKSGRRRADLVHPDGVNEAVFSPDGRYVVTRGKDVRARLWECDSGRMVSEGMLHSSWVDAATFTQEGRSVITASRDMSLRWWSLEGLLRGEATTVAEVRAPAPVSGARLDPTGVWVAAWLGDNSVAVWGTSSRAMGPVLEHRQPVYTIDFDQSGSRLATAAGTAGARIWDVRSGHAVSEVFRSPGLTYLVRFHPSGRWLLTGGEDGRIRYWPAEPALVPAAPWLASYAEAEAVLQGDSSRGFRQTEVMTWPQFQARWGTSRPLERGAGGR